MSSARISKILEVGATLGVDSRLIPPQGVKKLTVVRAVYIVRFDRVLLYGRGKPRTLYQRRKSVLVVRQSRARQTLHSILNWVCESGERAIISRLANQPAVVLLRLDQLEELEKKAAGSAGKEGAGGS